MGTHGAFAFTTKNYHLCIERTLDGSMVCEAVDKWIERGALEEMLGDDEIGNGSVQYCDKREHRQLYFYHANHKEKILYTNLIVLKENYKDYEEEDFLERLKQQVDLRKRLKKVGWKLDRAWDCCDPNIPGHIPNAQHKKYQEVKREKDGLV